MDILKKIYKLLPSHKLKETVKEIYFNLIRDEKFERYDKEYITIFKNKIKIITKRPLYYVVKDIKRYETFYKVKKGDVVIDAGANHAYLSIYYSNKVGLNGVVHAFEPDKHNISEIESNLNLNPNVKNVIVHDELIWKENTHIDFFESGTVSSSIHFKPDKSTTILKKAITLDSFIEFEKINRLDFIKMDIEGAEIEAMNGLNKILNRFTPNLAIASYHWVNGEQTYKSIESYFRNINYPFKTVFFEDGEIITFAGRELK